MENNENGRDPNTIECALAGKLAAYLTQQLDIFINSFVEDDTDIREESLGFIIMAIDGFQARSYCRGIRYIESKEDRYAAIDRHYEMLKSYARGVDDHMHGDDVDETD